MNYSILFFRNRRSLINNKAILSTPITRFLTKLSSENRIRTNCAPLKPPKKFKQFYRQNEATLDETKAIAIPTHADFPQLPKSIFSEPWVTKNWLNLTEIGKVIEESVLKIRRGKGVHQWKSTYVWISKDGKKYVGTCSTDSKNEARKTSASQLLAILGKNGVLAEISKELEDAETERKKLQKEMGTIGPRGKLEIYNYAASFLAIPQVKIVSHTHAKKFGTNQAKYTVSIKLEEQNIFVEASGNKSSLTEVEACLKFKKAVEEYHREKGASSSSNSHDSTPDTISNNASLVLNHLQAKDFIFYCKQLLPNSSVITLKSGNLPNIKHDAGNLLHSCQVMLNGDPIGSETFASKYKDAEILAYLTGAVDLAKKYPENLKKFFNENRGISGKRVDASITVPFKISHDLLSFISKVTRPILRAHVDEPIDSRTEADQDYLKFGRPFCQKLGADEITTRNKHLRTKHEAYLRNPSFQTIRELRASLPMNMYRNDVLRLIDQNTYSVIVGETGSGKTTQVPAIILEDATIREMASNVNIICTQPRRIAAQSVARRVAYERGEKLQETVGYHVYMDAKRPPSGGSITYCTTQILLKQLQHCPDEVMDSVSHIIVGEDGIMRPCPSISVPGKTYPVEKKYLDDVIDELNRKYHKSHRLDSCNDTQRYLQIEDDLKKEPSLDFNWKKIRDGATGALKENEDSLIPYNLIATTIAHISKSNSDGAILTFLPGLKDLEEVRKRLLQGPLGVNFSNASEYRIILLHSLMTEAQNLVFEQPPAGCRKIVLATNIAETSITIPDVKYVVDIGKLNEMHYDPITRIKNLKCTWISKSNSRQRAGRAGRVQNGFYYALFSKNRLDTLSVYGVPQLLRSDLQEVCLGTKGLTLNYSIKEFLSDAVEKPPPGAVDTAIKDLINLGALTKDEEITPLGKLLHSLPVDPDMGKLIVFGVIFRCFDPLLMLAAASCERDFFVRPPLKRREADAARRYFGHNSNSDTIALINAYREAQEIRRKGRYSEFAAFMSQNFLSTATFENIQKRMIQIKDVLVASGLIPKPSMKFYRPDDRVDNLLNENSGNQNLIRALSLARCPGNLAVRIGTTSKFRTKTEGDIMIRSGLNAIRSASSSHLPKNALISFTSMHKDDNQTLCLRNTTVISPLTVALFGGPLSQKGENLRTDQWISYRLSTNSDNLTAVKCISNLRNGLAKMLSMSFMDLAQRKSLVDDNTRRDFSSAIASVLDRSEAEIAQYNYEKQPYYSLDAGTRDILRRTNSRLASSSGQRP
ncbi:ATP-dependent RNA helicase A [Blumeria hordei DH14]|uniref:ATP-dependent RNA helicase A n=1 Tax=Blumeria graminis f. sp. hordei (strain DH14) TaxID=546991 RepID=N1JF90_BLUG1|nr:ATP-dependent RNA helicase A [Blumeria hordei DH14]